MRYIWQLEDFPNSLKDLASRIWSLEPQILISTIKHFRIIIVSIIQINNNNTLVTNSVHNIKKDRDNEKSNGTKSDTAGKRHRI